MTRHEETSAEALGPSRVKSWRTAGLLLELHNGEPTALPVEKLAALGADLGGPVAQSAAPTLADTRRERLRARVLATRDFIVTNYRENISLAQLAGLAHSSPYHFNRLFARHVGMPPHAFQNQVRVERSKALILEGTSIAQVAMQTGFFDQSHFTRYFRRIVGVTPSSYALARR